MIARTDIFDHGRCAFGEKPCEENSALHLRTRHRQPVSNALQTGALLDHKRRAGFFAFGVKLGTHQSKGIDHALHRALRERGVADQTRLERLRSENARHQTHRRAGISTIEIAEGLREPARHSLHDQLAGLGRFDHHAELAHRGGGAAAVLALEEIADLAAPVGKRSEQDRAVRDAFIRRHADFGVNGGGAAGFENVLFLGAHLFGGRLLRAESSGIIKKCLERVSMTVLESKFECLQSGLQVGDSREKFVAVV